MYLELCARDVAVNPVSGHDRRSLMKEVHPNADVRSAAGKCIDAASANSSAVQLSRPLYDALSSLRSAQFRRRQLTASLPLNEAKASSTDILVSHDSVRIVAKTLENFQRQGVGIVPPAQEGEFARSRTSSAMLEHCCISSAHVLSMLASQVSCLRSSRFWISE
jgi:Zn-dependent oligopeptidase